MKNYTDILELHPEASMLTERYFEDPDHAVSEEQELFLEELLFLFTSQKDTDGAELRKKFEGYSVATLVDYLHRICQGMASVGRAVYYRPADP